METGISRPSRVARGSGITEDSHLGLRSGLGLSECGTLIAILIAHHLQIILGLSSLVSSLEHFLLYFVIFGIVLMFCSFIFID